MSTQVPPSRLDSTKDFSSLVPSAFARANAAYEQANTASGAAVSSTPKISSIVYPGNDTAANTGGGQTVTLTGSGFNAGATVLINGTYASVVSVANSTSLSFTTPVNSSGTYPLYIVNTDGGTGISVPGISYSGTPNWSTASGSIATLYETAALSNTVTATGDATISYSLYSGTLPPGSSLNTSTGLISGTSQGVDGSTTYTFTIRATDGQNQDTDRTFTITINPDAVTWSSPTDNSTVTAYEYTAISPITMSATSGAGKSITYTANTLPTGVSISGSTISGTPTAVANTNTLLTANAANTFKTVTRNINFVVNQDVVTWNSPADGTVTALVQDTTMSNVALSATSVAGQSIAYTANALPTGVTISGSNVTGTPTVLGNTISVITATAANTNRTATRTFTWVVSIANDTYFKNTTLLLNGETSVTPFISDSSNNSLALTIAGDTKPVLFNPYQGDGYYSNFFDGTGDYINAGSGASVNMTGDFTVEMWIYGTNTSWTGGDAVGATCLVDTRNQSNTTENNRLVLYMNSTGSYPNFYNAGTNTSTASTIPANVGVWNHIAYSRSGSTIKIFVNGVQGASFTDSTAFTAARWVIGMYASESGGTNNRGGFIGYISNHRIINGTALYTTAFTPPTSPLTAISGTSLLTCQSNRFIDKSTNNLTLTKAGDTLISPNIPFTANASYSTYGSTYFDGTGDYLTIAGTSTACALPGDFTIECWYYQNTSSALFYGTIFSTTATYATTNSLRISTGQNNNTIQVASGGSGVFNASVAFTPYTWVHLALVRSGTTLTLYQNGVSVGSATNSQSFVSDTFIIGDTQGSGAPYCFNGYMSNFRVVKGTAVYTSAFTPPTSPLTAISNTSLLTLQYNGGATNKGIIDNSNFNNIITRNGNTSQGTFSPYSVTGWSNYFDGTGDYLSAGSNSSFAVGTGDFTFQAWVYPTAYTSPVSAIFDTGSAVASGRFSVVLYSSGLVYVDSNANLLISSSTLPLNTWTLISIIRSSGTMTMYFNGTSVASGSIATNFTETQSYIGRTVDNYYFKGYISNLRLVKGTALANTVPTSPLTAIANTQLLTCQSNRLIDNSPNSFTLTRNGDVSVEAFDPFGSVPEATPISYSNYFDGTGDYLTTSDNAAFQFGTGDFTVEAWVYPSVVNSSQRRFYSYQAGGTSTVFWVGISSTNKFSAEMRGSGGANDTQIYSTTTPVASTWYHVAFVRSGTTTYLFVNGSLETTTTSQSQSIGSGGTFNIGQHNSADYWYGYLSNLRIVKGTALYTTSFTPSTTPLTAISNTSLLTCQSTRMIDNSTNAFTITAAGNVVPRIFNPFGYTAQSATSYTPSIHGGSVYFDGTGDYLTTPDSAFNLTTTTWCIEYWIYPTVIASGYYGLWALNASTGFRQGIYTDSGTHYLAVLNGGQGYGGFTLVSSNKVIVTGAWQHIALTSDGTTIRQFYNGVLTSTGSAASFSASTPTVGSWGAAYYFTGYIADFRITKGSAIYTSSFIPPAQTIGNYSTSYPAQLLLNFNNGGIIDQHSTNILETVGNAQLSTAVKKYNNASMYFDGTGDYLKIPNSQNFNFGSGNFTVEGWVYCTNTSPRQDIFTTPADGSGFNGLSFGIYNGNFELIMCWSTGSWQILFQTAGSITANTWYHFAVVRNSGTLTVYINGSSTYTNSGLSTGSLVFGTDPATISYGRVNQSDAKYLYGYIDDFRITKGYARYTSNFTAPTSALITK